MVTNVKTNNSIQVGRNWNKELFDLISETTQNAPTVDLTNVVCEYVKKVKGTSQNCNFFLCFDSYSS